MTNEQTNSFGQKIGQSMPNWTARDWPPHTSLIGQYCSIERLDPDRHLDDLFSAFSEAEDGGGWTYMFMGPFAKKEDYARFLQEASNHKDPLHHAIVANGRAVGTAAL